MAHCTYTQVNELLRIGSTTELNEGSTIIKAKITDADAYIDAVLETYGLTVSGTSEALITAASKYLSAALYIMDLAEVRGEKREEVEYWKQQSEQFLNAYIEQKTGGRKDWENDYGRMRRLYSTTYPNP